MAQKTTTEELNDLLRRWSMSSYLGMSHPLSADMRQRHFECTFKLITGWRGYIDGEITADDVPYLMQVLSIIQNNDILNVVKYIKTAVLVKSMFLRMPGAAASVADSITSVWSVAREATIIFSDQNPELDIGRVCAWAWTRSDHLLSTATTAIVGVDPAKVTKWITDLKNITALDYTETDPDRQKSLVTGITALVQVCPIDWVAVVNRCEQIIKG